MITQQQKEFYAHNGYLVLHGLLTAVEIATLKNEAVAIFKGEMEKYAAIHFPHKISPLIYDFLKHEKIVGALRDMIGPDIKCMQSMLFVKAPGKKGQSWHQDEFYIPTRDKSLTDDQVQAVVQSPRSLWDRTYKERSWITRDVVGQPLYILDRLQNRIDVEYPGMKLAITEYDNGGGQHIAGTIAEADDLGIFGAHGLFAACMWLLTAKEPYSLAGFRAFRNFDGANHHFGDTSVEATSSNVADVAVYVSTDSIRPGRVVMVAINRSPQEQVTTINGQPLAGKAHLFQMTAATAAKQTSIQPVAAGVQPVSGTALSLTLPALSVTTIDIY